MPVGADPAFIRRSTSLRYVKVTNVCCRESEPSMFSKCEMLDMEGNWSKTELPRCPSYSIESPLFLRS